MKKYNLGNLATYLGSAFALQQFLSKASTGEGAVPVTAGDLRKGAAFVLDALRRECENMEGDGALQKQIEKKVRELSEDDSPELNHSVLAAELSLITEGIKQNLSSRLFMFIPPEKALYFGNPYLFGDRFHQAFPSKATVDMLQAGNSYAAGLPTACVFHSIIAAKLKVEIRDKKQPCPLSEGTWSKVIDAVKSKISEAHKLPASPRKRRRLEWFSRAADQCEYLRDIWRNSVSHTGKIYIDDEARAVITRVREFAELLARPIPK